MSTTPADPDAITASGDTVGADDATLGAESQTAPVRATVKVNTRPGDTPPGDLAHTVRAALQASADSTPLASPDRYAESRELGRGGMGRVLEATDRLLGRRVAVKQMLGSGDHGLRKRFDQEALVTAQLDHPGIPTVFERATGEDGKPYYTMRLIEGETLAQRLRAGKTFPERLPLLPVLLRVAQTLGFAHAKGVVHRDVKPDNVVVGSYGDAVLLDWGIAKVRGLGELRSEGGASVAPGDAALTAHGAVRGTPAYMAPEQARGETDKVDERSDVVALGAMLYHLLAGKAPYTGQTITEILAQARACTPPDLDTVAADTPPALRAAARKAMHADPAQRHANAAEFTRDVEGFMAQAVLRPVSRGMERFIQSVSWFGLVMCVVIAAFGWGIAPTFREMGMSAYFTLLFFVTGLAVAVVEWQTRGRHHLLVLGAGLAALTAGSAYIGAIAGMLLVNRYLVRPEVLANAEKYREAAAVGYVEAMGNVPYGLTLALVQAMVLAFAWRRAVVARQGQ